MSYLHRRRMEAIERWKRMCERPVFFSRYYKARLDGKIGRQPKSPDQWVREQDELKGLNPFLGVEAGKV